MEKSRNLGLIHKWRHVNLHFWRPSYASCACVTQILTLSPHPLPCRFWCVEMEKWIPKVISSWKFVLRTNIWIKEEPNIQTGDTALLYCSLCSIFQYCLSNSILPTKINAWQYCLVFRQNWSIQLIVKVLYNYIRLLQILNSDLGINRQFSRRLSFKP